jgi:hypothetical protein
MSLLTRFGMILAAALAINLAFPELKAEAQCRPRYTSTGCASALTIGARLRRAERRATRAWKDGVRGAYGCTFASLDYAENIQRERYASGGPLKECYRLSADPCLGPLCQ